MMMKNNILPGIYNKNQQTPCRLMFPTDTTSGRICK
jgi:hypothetical protein